MFFRVNQSVSCSFAAHLDGREGVKCLEALRTLTRKCFRAWALRVSCFEHPTKLRELELGTSMLPGSLALGQFTM